MRTKKMASESSTIPLHNNSGQSRKNDMKRQLPFYIMMLPGLLLVFVFSYLPLPGIIIAFKDFNSADGLYGSPWIDPLFKNFEFFFTSDTARMVTFNTIFYNLIQAVSVTACALFLAILLNEIASKHLTALYKGALLLPTFLSWVVIQYIVYGLLSVDSGIVNSMIQAMGGQEVYWYSEPSYWRFIMPFAYLWKTVGYYSVFYVAAIAGISPEYYEAAQLDGASKWHQIKNITLPLLKPTVIVLSLLWVGKLFNGGLGDWNAFYTITNDSSALYSSTDVIDTYVFRALKKMSDYGMSGAVSLYQSLVGFALVLISNTVIKKIDPENSLF